MRIRLRTAATAALSAAVFLTPLAAAPAAATTPQKLVIIVGPTGSLTQDYKADGNAVASAAAAAGAEVVKVYSPNATWDKVRSAVQDANVVVYMGHGNGFPNPYSTWGSCTANTLDQSCELTDRDNGWGVNKVAGAGNSETNMVYCGEQALLGTLSSSNWRYPYCTGGISPAPGFVMVYAHACYSPGAGEARPSAGSAIASARVANFSYPVLALGAGAYFATDYGDASDLVDRVLRNRDTAFGQIFMDGVGFDQAALEVSDHPDVASSQVWTQETTNTWLGTDYWYAYAGEPTRTPAGGTATVPDMPDVAKIRPNPGSKWAKADARVRVWFTTAVDGVSRKTVRLFDDYGFLVPARVRYRAGQEKAILVPRDPLQPKTWYRVELESGITASSSGMGLAARSWSFRTGSFTGDGSVTNWPDTARLSFSVGVHTGYRFNAYGRPTAAKTSTLAGSSSAATSTRRQLRGQTGWWYYVTNGVWAGYWLRESSALYLSDAPQPVSGVDAPATYDPGAPLGILRGTHTGYTFSSSGAMTAEKTAHFGSDRSAATTSVAFVANQGGGWFLVVGGPFDGYWLRASDAVVLESGGS